MKRRFTGLLCFGAALAISLMVSAEAVQYRIVDLGIPEGYYATNSYTSAINNNGQIVGFSRGLSDRAVMWNNGKITELGIKYAFDINDKGQMPGESWDRGCLLDNETITYLGCSRGLAINNNTQIVGTLSSGRAYLWESGTVTDLGVLPGYNSSTACNINDSGQIVGYSGPHATIWDGKTITDLGVLPGDDYSAALGINERGDIVGWSYAEAVEGHYIYSSALLWNDGTMTDLGMLEGYYGSWACSINNSGQIVGYSQGNVVTDLGMIYRATLWDSGTITDLGSLPGYMTSVATDINDKGQIVGYSYGYLGARACMWEPITTVPEPSSILAILSGIAGLGGMALRRRK